MTTMSSDREHLGPARVPADQDRAGVAAERGRHHGDDDGAGRVEQPRRDAGDVPFAETAWPGRRASLRPRGTSHRAWRTSSPAARRWRPAIRNDSHTADPATAPAAPSRAKIPAPTIEPTPMNVAWMTVIRFFGTVVDMGASPRRRAPASSLARRLPPGPGQRNPSPVRVRVMARVQVQARGKNVLDPPAPIDGHEDKLKLLRGSGGDCCHHLPVAVELPVRGGGRGDGHDGTGRAAVRAWSRSGSRTSRIRPGHGRTRVSCVLISPSAAAAADVRGVDGVEQAEVPGTERQRAETGETANGLRRIRRGQQGIQVRTYRACRAVGGGGRRARSGPAGCDGPAGATSAAAGSCAVPVRTLICTRGRHCGPETGRRRRRIRSAASQQPGHPAGHRQQDHSRETAQPPCGRFRIPAVRRPISVGLAFGIGDAVRLPARDARLGACAGRCARSAPGEQLEEGPWDVRRQTGPPVPPGRSDRPARQTLPPPDAAGARRSALLRGRRPTRPEPPGPAGAGADVSAPGSGARPVRQYQPRAARE